MSMSDKPSHPINGDRPRRILFMMSGSIAAYKACFVISRLVQQSHEVQVIITPNTLNFVGRATLEGLSGRPVHSETFEAGQAMDHIYWARWADLIILCPATANTINKMAAGLADDLVTNLYLAHDFSKPFLVAPAMNSAMYHHPRTQASIAELRALGMKILSTGSGTLACGELGAGRLLEPEQLLKIIEDELGLVLEAPQGSLKNSEEMPAPKQFLQKKILITSGGTQEAIDAMRVLTNLSTGQTGAFLADSFTQAGFDVHYLGAASAERPKLPCKHFSFASFADLDEKLQDRLKHDDYLAVIHAAAVSDFHLHRILCGETEVAKTVGKISSHQTLQLELKPNYKILPRLKDYARQSQPIVVGFKFTATPNLEERRQAVNKLFGEGGVDLVIHNDRADIDKTKGLHSFTIYSGIEREPGLEHHASNKKSLAEHLIQFFNSTPHKSETENYDLNP